MKVSLEQGERFIEAVTGCNRIQPVPKSLITAGALLKKKNGSINECLNPVLKSPECGTCCNIYCYTAIKESLQ